MLLLSILGFARCNVNFSHTARNSAAFCAHSLFVLLRTPALLAGDFPGTAISGATIFGATTFGAAIFGAMIDSPP